MITFLTSPYLLTSVDNIFLTKKTLIPLLNKLNNKEPLDNYINKKNPQTNPPKHIQTLLTHTPTNLNFLNIYLSHILGSQSCPTQTQTSKTHKLILALQRTTLTLKTNRITNFKITTGIGTGQKWVGIGEGTSTLFKKSYTKALTNAQKHIYNLQFTCDDYKCLKYKGNKFKALKRPTNLYNLKTYTNITNLSGDKKIKLITYSRGPARSTIKALLHFF